MVSDRFGYAPCPHGTTGGIKALGEDRLRSFQYSHAILANLSGPEPGSIATDFSNEPTNAGLAHTERRELVLVEADRGHGWSALGDALPGKQRRKNNRGRAGSMREKEN